MKTTQQREREKERERKMLVKRQKYAFIYRHKAKKVLFYTNDSKIAALKRRVCKEESDSRRAEMGKTSTSSKERKQSFQRSF